MSFKLELVPSPKLEVADTPSGRVYVVPTGIGKDTRTYYSVTTRLGRHFGVQQGLEDWKKRVGLEEARHVSQQALAKGSALHAMCEDYILNRPRKKAMPTTLASFKRVQPLLDQSLERVYGVEHALYSHSLFTAGRADVIGQWEGTNAIIDFKTTRSDVPKKEEHILAYFLQAACYAMMAEERMRIEVPHIVVLIITENDRPQVFAKKTDAYREQVTDIFVEEPERYR